jgi:hypothetical protein
MMFWFLDRFSPYGYHKLGGEKGRNNFDLQNSLVISMRTISNLNQEWGRAWSTRLLVLGYCLFAIIIVASYIANVTAALTHYDHLTRISSLNDIRTNGLKYSIVKNSAPYEYMSKDPSVADIRGQMVAFDNIDDAVQAVRNRDVSAMIWTSAKVGYIVNRPPCDMQKVGDLFDEGSYALAIPFGFPYKKLMTFHILAMREDGYLQNLYKEWFIDKGGCGTVTQSISHYSLRNLGGVWIMLCVFLGLALFMLVFENLYYYIIYLKGKRRIPQLKYLHRFLGGNKEPVTSVNIPPETGKGDTDGKLVQLSAQVEEVMKLVSFLAQKPVV